MNKTDSQIAKLLRNQGLLDQFQQQSILDHLGQRGGRFHLAVLELGLIPEDKVVKAVSQVTGFQLVSIEKMRDDPDALRCLPGDFCAQHGVFPCALRDNKTTLWLAMEDPTSVNTRNAARANSGREIRPLVGRPSEIRRFIRERYADPEKEESPYVVGAIDLSLTPEEEEAEFKVTDISGKTMVKHKKEVKEATGPLPRTTSFRFGPDEPAEPALDPELAERLDQLIGYQEKAERIIRGFVRLLVDKGLFSAEEFRVRLKK